MVDPFDLDAARTARLEARGEPRLFLFGGQKFELPAELPAEFAYLLDDAKEALRFLLGGDFDDFWALRPSGEDLVELVAWLTKTYGAALGESMVSGNSSKPGGGPSRPTSLATTRSTSARRSSARKRSGPAGSSA
jgi:hypothetical protein